MQSATPKQTIKNTIPISGNSTRLNHASALAYRNMGGDWMDVTSLFSGVMIGAGLGLAFSMAIIYKHHREVIMNNTKPDLVEVNLREDLLDAEEKLAVARARKS